MMLGAGTDGLVPVDEAFTTDLALDLAAQLERERALSLEAELRAARERDRARLDARLAAAEAVAAQLLRDAEQEPDPEKQQAERQRAAEFRAAQRAACAADGQSVLRKRVRESVSAHVAPRRPMPRLFGADEWIWQSRDAAAAIIDEDVQAQQHMLTLTLPHSAVLAPPRGQRRVCAVVSRIDDMRLERWMLVHAPALFTTNVVATANFGVSINALALVNRISGASFNPHCFAAVKLRLHGSTHLIFSEGMVVCTGSLSADNARVACVETAQLLMRAGVLTRYLNFEVRNVVSTTNTGFDVDLAAIAHTYPINAHYIPDCFPGLTFRIAQSRMVLTVFKSGCCILTGVKSRREAMLAWTWFYCRILWQFQIDGATQQMSDVEFGRRARQDDSTVQLVCESVRDVTQSLLASAIAAQREQLDTPADEYYAALRSMARRLGPVPTAQPKLSLEDWLAQTEAGL